MSAIEQPYQRILVAMDFSLSSDAVLKQAVWLARRSGAKIVLIHVRADLRRAIASSSYQARMDFFHSEGDLFQREIRKESDAKMQQAIANLHATDLDIKSETLFGDSFIEIIHAVQNENYDLVLAGTRGLAAWEQFLVGSTAKKLIRHCPATVWVVKAEHCGPPKVILAATDFSDVSRKAVLEGMWLAQQANSEFHLLHVIDSTDMPADLFDRIPQGNSLRQEINAEAEQSLKTFVDSLGVEHERDPFASVMGSPMAGDWPPGSAFECRPNCNGDSGAERNQGIVAGQHRGESAGHVQLQHPDDQARRFRLDDSAAVLAAPSRDLEECRLTLASVCPSLCDIRRRTTMPMSANNSRGSSRLARCLHPRLTDALDARRCILLQSEGRNG